jgi:hypothetical protein
VEAVREDGHRSGRVTQGDLGERDGEVEYEDAVENADD